MSGACCPAFFVSPDVWDMLSPERIIFLCHTAVGNRCHLDAAPRVIPPRPFNSSRHLGASGNIPNAKRLAVLSAGHPSGGGIFATVGDPGVPHE